MSTRPMRRSPITARSRATASRNARLIGVPGPPAMPDQNSRSIAETPASAMPTASSIATPMAT
jgi:hypothetical protein